MLNTSCSGLCSESCLEIWSFWFFSKIWIDFFSSFHYWTGYLLEFSFWLLLEWISFYKRECWTVISAKKGGVWLLLKGDHYSRLESTLRAFSCSHHQKSAQLAITIHGRDLLNFNWTLCWICSRIWQKKCIGIHSMW